MTDTRWKVTLFQPADYVALVNGLGRPWPVSPDRAATTLADNGPAFTGWWDGVPVACAGLTLPWPGLAQAWALWGPEAPRHARRVHAAVIHRLGLLMQKHRLRRVEAVVDAGAAQSLRWARHLGFRWEADLPKYGPAGETFCRVVLFPEEWR